MPNTKRMTKRGGRGKNGATKTALDHFRIPKEPRSICPFPARMSSRFHYTTSFNLVEGSTGTGSFYVWNANSLFDPDVTSTGHQPLYYDQLFSASGPYQRFLVTKAVLDIELLCQGSSQIAVGVYSQVGATDGPTLERLVEKPNVVWKVMSPSSSGAPRCRLRLSCHPAALFGVCEAIYTSDDSYQGFYNANPSRLASFIFAVYAMAGSASVGSVTGLAQLTYSAECFNRVAVGGS